MLTWLQDDQHSHSSRSLSQRFFDFHQIQTAHEIVKSNIAQVFFASESVCCPAKKVDTTCNGTQTDAYVDGKTR